MKWILAAFVLGCICASLGCRVGQNELIYTTRAEHLEYWHDVDKSHSKAMLEFKYQYKF